MARPSKGGIPVPPMTGTMWREALKTVKREEPFDVVRAKYDRRRDALELALRCGVVIQFPRTRIRELARAAPDDVAKVKIQPGGDGLSFDEIDKHISVPGLLRDELGSLFARAIGRQARGRTSEKKAASSKENGKKGGRPKKKAA